MQAEKFNQAVYVVDGASIETLTFEEYLKEYWSDVWTTPDGLRSDLYLHETSRTVYAVDGREYPDSDTAIDAAEELAVVQIHGEDHTYDDYSDEAVKSLAATLISTRMEDAYEVRSYRHRRALEIFGEAELAEEYILESYEAFYENGDSRKSRDGDNTPPYYSTLEEAQSVSEIAE